MCVHHARDKTGMVYKEQGAEVVSLSALFKWHLLYHIHGMSYIKLFFFAAATSDFILSISRAEYVLAIFSILEGL